MSAKEKKSKYTFIDLFAGLGGFHFALKSLGHKCVFASELKEDLRELYKINHPGTQVEGDITKIEPKDIPPHDILCAGFPCQPFSQAGNRQGFNDVHGRGNLFDYIVNILEFHKPRYVFLENVSNLKGHDGGHTWKIIQKKLTEKKYSVKEAILSPHEFGIPQHRKRIYIVGVRNDIASLDNFIFPKGEFSKICDIHKLINESDENVIPLRADTLHQLDVWQKFIDNTIKNSDTIPSFPIWAMEFGATYDFENIAPAFQTIKHFAGKKGKFGKKINGKTVKECVCQLPIYAQSDKNKTFPNWKIRYIKQNRDFYKRHKNWLDNWLKNVSDFDNSHLKFEWNCGKQSTPVIEDKIVQFRASGIRVKLPTFVPALNLVGTQIPIFPWIRLPNRFQKNGKTTAKGRYMSLDEAAAVQGMQNISFGNKNFKLSQTRCYEALGNAVNVEIVKKIVTEVFDYVK